METDFLLSRIPECYLAFPGTGHRKKDDRNQENSEHWSSKLTYFHAVVTVLEASVVLAASVFHFSEVSLQDANR